jgi:hypothetical protein
LGTGVTVGDGFAVAVNTDIGVTDDGAVNETEAVTVEVVVGVVVFVPSEGCIFECGRTEQPIKITNIRKKMRYLLIK